MQVKNAPKGLSMQVTEGTSEHFNHNTDDIVFTAVNTTIQISLPILPCIFHYLCFFGVLLLNKRKLPCSKSISSKLAEHLDLMHVFILLSA